MKLMPNTPEVLVFDTSFHKTIPEKAYLYAKDSSLAKLGEQLKDVYENLLDGR